MTGGNGNDVFIYSGGEDVITDYDAKDKISVNSGLAYSGHALNGNDIVINYGAGNSLKIIGGKDKVINLNSSANLYTANAIFDSKGTSATLASSLQSFDAKGYAKLVTIDGSAASLISILGNDKANRIIAGKSGSTLNGGKGNDTLVGGNGSDVFACETGGGNDFIVDYGAGDKISLGNGVSISDVTTKNNDVIIKVGSNTLTVKNSSTVTLTSNGKDSNFSGGVFVEGDSITLPSTSAKTYTLGSAIKNLDASKITKAIKITGNALDNSILSGSGNDTLEGLGGNDTLTGGNGSDVFIYSGGNDVITDYDAKDKISIGGGLTSSGFSVNGSDVILNYGTGNSLTIKDVGDDAISFLENKKTTANVYTTDGIFDSKKTSVTLASSTKAFTADAKLQTIDGSAASGVSILGNAKANKIIDGGGSVVFKNVDSSTTFNINGETYHVEGKTLTK